jgi:hypothetical protein
VLVIYSPRSNCVQKSINIIINVPSRTDVFKQLPILTFDQIKITKKLNLPMHLIILSVNNNLLGRKITFQNFARSYRKSAVHYLQGTVDISGNLLLTFRV